MEITSHPNLVRQIINDKEYTFEIPKEAIKIQVVWIVGEEHPKLKCLTPSGVLYKPPEPPQI